MNKFQVIIPVINPGLADVLIKNMEENTLLPEKVIIIDNSQCSYKPQSDKFLIEIYHSISGMVNESLNLGISKVSKNCDYVSLFNDDIQIGSWFFERIARVFKEALICSAVCPNTIIDTKKLPLIEGPFIYHQMKKREGWAMTFDKHLLNMAPPIPDTRIKTFHGDDWFWLYTTRHIGMLWYKDLGNNIYHMIGQSVLKLNKRRDKKTEHNEYFKILGEL